MDNRRSVAPSWGQDDPRWCFQLRAERPQDEALVRDLYVTGRGAFLGTLPLPPPLRDQLVDLQLAARAAELARRHPQAHPAIIVVDGEDVGRLVVDRAGPPWYVADIAVVTGRRGQGLGTAILRWLMATSGAAGLELHVASDNPAGRLYLRLGFAAAGVDGLDRRLRWCPERQPDRVLLSEAGADPGLPYYAVGSGA